MYRNIAYCIGYKKEEASPVSIGKTIFDDDHGFFSAVMWITYALLFPNFFEDDYENHRK